MTEMDGKNVLKLIPVSNPLNNVKPRVQTEVLCPTAKGNVLLSGHEYAKTSFASTNAPAVAKISELKILVPKYLIFLKPFNQPRQLNATVVKQNPITLTVSGIQSSYSADRPSLQKSFVPICLDTSTTIMKIENTPLSMKPPVLPSGHHLQIPAPAKVKSLPVFVLPPIIQNKMLGTAAASNISGTGENINVPIFISPVNTMKISASESLETKSVGEVSSSLIRATSQKFINSSAKVSTSGSMENKRTPMKWVVHENPESSTSYITPVKSSNKVASELLKTLTDIKNTKNNSASILPICSSSLHESLHGGKMPSKKDNTLVTCNVQECLLAKRDTNIVSTLEPSKQESTNVRKQTSELISLVTDNTITNQVINLVLSKNKRIASNLKTTKFNDSMIPYLESEVNKDFKAESTPSASPHDNLQISSITQHKSVSSGRSASIGINDAQKYVKKENAYDSSCKDLSTKGATDPTSPPVVHHAVKEEEQQAEITSGVPIWMEHIQEQQKKHYLQLRKKFGLSKEERVYLRRVSSVPSKNSEAFVFSNSVQMNDIDNLMSIPMKSESEKEEKIIGEQGGNVNIKRKTKATPILENPKKRKNDVTRMQNSDFECNSSYSVMENLNNSCTQNLLEQEHSTSFLHCRHNVSNPWVSNSSEENRVLNSTSNCPENETALDESSFKKDIFPFSLPDLEEKIKEEKITRLKQLLREREAALEAIREKMHQC
ncbi:ligand-dependent nuclear receptor-interacting factor 1-like [Erythrolamprus reginae]|uniref:ligand-dependent nuclear receptor-interacting factor 1-like n=1 Tax=Erythrolamprus reginae TaxID=121349 RepID=UPI00396CD829